MYSFVSRVRYSETGEDQELTLPGIVNYLQDCSVFQSEDLRMGIDYMEQGRRAWMLSFWQIVIERCPRLGEEIVVGTWPYDFKGMFGLRNFVIQDRAGAYLVKANSVWFLYDTVAGRPVKVTPEDIRGYTASTAKKLDMAYAPRRIALPAEAEAGAPVTVVRHHIDTNHHVNNAQYVAIAREALPVGTKARELRVEYRKAAVLGDVIVPWVSRHETGYTIDLRSPGGETYAAVWMRTGPEDAAG